MKTVEKSRILSMVLLASVGSISLGTASLAFAGDRAAYPNMTPSLLPPSPEAGKCYARVEIPAEYTSTTENVVVEAGYTTIEAVPGQLVPSQEKILTKEASVRYDVRQPSYSTVTEQVMVRPSYEKLHVSKPNFAVVPQTISGAAPKLIWKRGNPGKLMAQGYKIHSTADGGVQGQGYSSLSDYSSRSGSATRCGDLCEIWCLVEEPSESVTFNRRVMTSPGSVRREEVPAKFTTITKQVVSDPGGVREIPVPAEYQTLSVEKLAQASTVREVSYPPKYGTVAKKNLVSPLRYEWRQVVCKPGTGAIRSSQSYAQPTTHITATPQPVSSAYSHSSGYSSVPAYTAPRTGYYGDAYDTQSRNAASTTYCGGTECVNAGIHSPFESRDRSYEKMGSGNSGYISESYELPQPTSDNLGAYPQYTGRKRVR